MKRAFKVKKLSKKEHELTGGHLRIRVVTVRKPNNSHAGEFQCEVHSSTKHDSSKSFIVNRLVEGDWNDVFTACLEYWRW